MRCISNHTACRFAEKTRFFRSLWAGRRCAAASRSAFFKGKTLYPWRGRGAAHDRRGDGGSQPGNRPGGARNGRGARRNTRHGRTGRRTAQSILGRRLTGVVRTGQGRGAQTPTAKEALWNPAAKWTPRRCQYFHTKKASRQARCTSLKPLRLNGY